MYQPLELIEAVNEQIEVRKQQLEMMQTELCNQEIEVKVVERGTCHVGVLSEISEIVERGVYARGLYTFCTYLTCLWYTFPFLRLPFRFTDEFGSESAVEEARGARLENSRESRPHLVHEYEARKGEKEPGYTTGKVK